MSQFPPAKRKRDDESVCDSGLFKKDWIEEFYFVLYNGKPRCLICDWVGSDKCIKRYNIKRHYETAHLSKKDKLCYLDGQIRIDTIAKMKNRLEAQTSMFTKCKSEGDKILQASLTTSLIITKHMKPFSDGDIFKEAIVAGSNILCPEKADMFSKISLSRQTVTRRINDLYCDIKQQFTCIII